MGAIQKFTNLVGGSRASDYVRGAVDWLKGARSGVQGWAGSMYQTASNGSTFIGLNYSEVPNIRQAIRTYVDNIQKVADGLNTEANAEIAVHGEITNATKSYMMAIKEVVDSYVSTLLAYSDKMQEYYETYKASDTQLSSDVSSEAKSLQSSAASSTYTEKK